MKYLKVWTSFRDVLQPLKLDEIGSLFLMMLNYADTGEIPTEFIGNEAFLFPVAKQQIDLAAERAETLRQNGAKGGLAKSKNKQTLANDSKSYQTIANDIKSKQNVAEKKSNVMKCNEKKGNESLLDDDEAHKIQSEQNRVLDAAKDAGFKLTNNETASLIALYADLGLVRLLDGIKSCSEHGVANLAYLRAVLNGEPKKEKPRVNAQDYKQRSYDDVTKELMAEQERDMEEFMKRSAAG